MTIEHSGKLNGYKPKSVGDIVAIAVLVSMLVSCVAWGLKLEAELNIVRLQVMELRREVDRGVLPRAEERIESLQKEVNELKRRNGIN